MINQELQTYIVEHIFPIYEKNDAAHNLDHIFYVINRSLTFASCVPDVNMNMVYTIAAYHDIGHYIDAKHHEKISGEILAADVNLRKFFEDEQIATMQEAIEDHRASTKKVPRSIYGKIVSSADRNTVVELALKRTYAYRLKHHPHYSLQKVMDESREHLSAKFGKAGYAKDKMYFLDEAYFEFLQQMQLLVADKTAFERVYQQVNKLDNPWKFRFDQIRNQYLDKSLDQCLYSAYCQMPTDKIPFEMVKASILEAAGIDEYTYYTKKVSSALKRYVEEFIFPQYDKNDQAHGISHIKTVICRSFALHDTFHLGLDPDMVYAIAAYHDLGKYEDYTIHEKIAASKFKQDEQMNHFFSKDQQETIKEAIEDHRSSAAAMPRSVYGKLISSADRNTTIAAVFTRSFLVAQERMPQMDIPTYLDYTYHRLLKRYSYDQPEHMFFEDEIYRVFIQDMRMLLQDEKKFKQQYCDMNQIPACQQLIQDHSTYGKSKTKKGVSDEIRGFKTSL